LLLAPRAWLALALQPWQEPAAQVSPVFAKLALQALAYPVLQPCWACPAWQVAARFDQLDRPRNFRSTTQAGLFARANQEPSPQSRGLFRELLLNA
jgi:hypothetical protein